MSATLTLPLPRPSPSTRAIKPGRVIAAPVLACERCGDDLVAFHPPLICVPCARKAARLRRLAARRAKLAEESGEATE